MSSVHRSHSGFFCCIGRKAVFKLSNDDSSQNDELILLERKFSTISGCNRKHSQIRKKSSQSATPIKFLTSKERHLIINCWRNIPDKAEIGERLYCHIFMQKPGLLRLFPFGESPMEAVREHPAFKRQSLVFAQFLNSTVDHLSTNDGDAFRKLCAWSGDRHARITRIRFQPEWWELFVTALLDVVQPYCRASGPVLQAWRTLMNEVLLTMQEAFEQARRDLPDPAPSGSTAIFRIGSSRGNSTEESQCPFSGSFAGVTRLDRDLCDSSGSGSVKTSDSDTQSVRESSSGEPLGASGCRRRKTHSGSTVTNESSGDKSDKVAN